MYLHAFIDVNKSISLLSFAHIAVKVVCFRMIFIALINCGKVYFVKERVRLNENDNCDRTSRYAPSASASTITKIIREWTLNSNDNNENVTVRLQPHVLRKQIRRATSSNLFIGVWSLKEKQILLHFSSTNLYLEFRSTIRARDRSTKRELNEATKPITNRKWCDFLVLGTHARKCAVLGNSASQ